MSKDEIFIIGGGPSLRGFPFYQLEDKTTIAVNEAALDVPNPTYCITADSGTFRKLQEGYFKEIDTSWVVVTNPNHCTMKWENGKFKNIKTGFVYNLFAANMLIKNAGTDGIGFSFKDFITGYNSGFCGFQLAVLLGYKKIYLLGFDMTRQGSDCHYHNRYKGSGIKKDSLDRFYNNFALALKIIKEETDIEVISCSGVSRLNKIIPYKSFAEIIKQKEIVAQTLPITTGDIMKKRFSILICSLEDRKKSLNRLLGTLQPQKTDEVEILIEVDNGKITTGAKRNLLLKKATGDYVAFVDDDDLVSEDYISKILEAIKTNPDCCGMEGKITFQKRKVTKKFIHSMKYKAWFEENKIYYRCPNHISPVKRELALQVMFPDIAREEDKSYSLRLIDLLKTEVYIKGPIYFYFTR